MDSAEFILTVLRESWHVLNEAAPWLLFGFAASALVKAVVPDSFVAKHLGNNSASSVVKASVLGVPLPLCSCGVLPAAAGMRKQGASKGATAAFLISTPETGADSIAVSYALLDPVMTVIRPVSAFISATLAGLAINTLPDSDDSQPTPGASTMAEARADTGAAILHAGIPAQGSLAAAEFAAQDSNPPSGGCGCSSGCCADDTPEPQGFKARLRGGIEYAFGEMMGDIGTWMLVGIVAAGVISALVPDDFFQNIPGGEFGSLAIMLVVGIPLYICATASTPIAASMALKGLSPGAALVFLLAGPATNTATMAVVAKLLGKRVAVIYVASIAATAITLGWLVNRLYTAMGLDVMAWANEASAHEPGIISIASSILLLALVLRTKLPGRASGCGCGQHSHGHAQ